MEALHEKAIGLVAGMALLSFPLITSIPATISPGSANLTLFCVPGDKRMRGMTINGVKWEGFAPEKEVVIVAPHYAREISGEVSYWPTLAENIYV